ncbi:MAG: AAA family ATPase [Caldilineaceae bacterium]|nr:AAA family ATPase [Caldilineaceae bacterium]
MFYDWKFRFKDLGPVDDATLELGDLTIITGRNNTGKTYMVYTLYGFLRDFSELADEIIEEWSTNGRMSPAIPFSAGEIAKQLLKSGHFESEFSMQAFNADRVQLIRQMFRRYSHNKIDDVFNARSGTFRRAVFDAEIGHGESDRSLIGLTFDVQTGGDLSIIFDKDKLYFALERDKRIERKERERTEVRADERIRGLLLESNLRQAYARFLFYDTQDVFNRTLDCSTSVRLAVSLFYPELESKRRFTVRQIQQAKDDQDQRGDTLSPAEIIRTNTSRYALPIDDEINFVKTIPNLPSEWATSEKGEAERELEKIVGGSFTKSDGILYFIPSKGSPDQTGIPLHLASSSAVEMSRLFFHFVLRREGGSPLLIIDEPESHLDTMNQIRFARALVQWVNSGMKILISTHSDFIVKEINNLIMLNGSFDDKENLVEELGYEEGDSIEPSKIKAYYAVDGGLEPCPMNAFGIEVRSFEDSIDELIRVSGVLGSRIMLASDKSE